MTDPVKPELPAVELPVAPAAAPVSVESNPGGTATSAPEATAAALPAAELKPFAASDEPTALETFVAERDAKAAAAKPAEPAKEAAKPADAGVPAEAKKPDPAKPDDKADAVTDPAKEAAKTETKPAEPAKPEPVEYEKHYKLPETLKMDDALKGKFNGALDAFRADPAKGIQGLVDLHNDQMQAYDKKLREDQQRAFADTRKSWQTQLKADPEFGGAGYQTAMTAIARVRDLGISSAKLGSDKYNSDLRDFDTFLRITGAGDHPAFHRLLHNLARWVDEPQASELPTNIKPPPSNGKAPNGDWKQTMYDNPRSGRTS